MPSSYLYKCRGALVVESSWPDALRILDVNTIKYKDITYHDTAKLIEIL